MQPSPIPRRCVHFISFVSDIVLRIDAQLVTGSLDYTVRLWQMSRSFGTSSTPRYGEPPLKIVLTHLMRSHRAPVACVAASRSWSLVVSGSEDGSLALWDLNRGSYIRSIWHGEGKDWTIRLAAIHESTVSSKSFPRDLTIGLIASFYLM